MKKIISTVSIFLILMSNLGASVFAADTTKIDHFAIIAPPTTKVGEAFDIKVEARDKDDKIITGYVGSVYFQSTTDFGATLPAQGKSVQFKEVDKGLITLSKAIIFKRAGNQTLTVTETIADAEGTVTIKVDPNSETSTGTTSDISIITPENNSSITSDTVTVSGKTKKNSKVVLKLNGKEVATLLSDDSGVYTKTLTSITQDTNILSVSLLDGNNTVVGSSESKFGLVNDAPKIMATSITPGMSVEASTPITIVTEAEAGLSELNITLDGSALKATEKTPGKYTVETVAPAKSGSYPISVDAKSSVGKVAKKDTAATLSVTDKPIVAATFRDVKITTEGTKVMFRFSVDNAPTDLSKFKIAYGTSTDSLSEEVMTYTTDKIGTGGVYNWYLDKLTPGNYTFKIFGAKADGSVIGELASESINTSVGKPGCTIANVGKISVATNKETTTLSWDAVQGALSYNLYKTTPAGDLELIQNLKDTKYTLFLSSGSVSYQDFALKALCDDKTESADASKASRVQTGPGAIAVLIILSALMSLFFFRRKFI